jgi:phosphoribosylamine--glycine ligase
MKFLIIDNQARGHSFACKLSACINTKKVFLLRDYLIPIVINNKISIITEPKKEDSSLFKKVLNLCTQKKINCVIIGTIDLMEKGLVDYLKKHNINTIGANQQASKLEGSKLFSKSLMNKYNIPTPEHIVLGREQGIEPINNDWLPSVMKANRVIKGCYSAIKIDDKKQLAQAFNNIIFMQNKYYKETDVLLEKLCKGDECSFTVLLSESTWEILPTCQDYKQLTATTTINTGGMGSIAPAPNISQKTYDDIVNVIIKPTLEAIKIEGLLYNGFLYFGIFIDEQKKPLLLELNCRIGDPEAQSILMLASNNIAEKIFNTAKNTLHKTTIDWKNGVACSVYTTPKGYPEAPQKNQVVNLPSKEKNIQNDAQYSLGAIIFDIEQQQWLSQENRTFCLSSYAQTLSQAREKTYSRLTALENTELLHRADIGF